MFATATEFIKLLRKNFRVQYIGIDSDGVSTYSVDLTRYRFNVTAQTPVIVIPKNYSGGDVKLITDKTSSIIRPQVDKVSIIIVQDFAEDVREGLSLSFPDLLFLGDKQLVRLNKSKNLIEDLKSTFTKLIGPNHLSPYLSTGAATGSMFFGRKSELSRILSKSSRSFGVWGMRRIGKTSLLEQVKFILVDQRNYPPNKVKYLECSTIDSPSTFFRRAVHREFPPSQARNMTPREFTNYLRSFSSAGTEPIIFMLDEIDNLVSLDAKTDINRPLFTLLRSAYLNNYCRLIISGFRVARNESRDINSPFFNFLEEINLDAFSLEETRQLIVEPLTDLKIKIASESKLIHNIYFDTGGLPQLIQFYCDYLVRKFVEEGASNVSSSLLSDIYYDSTLENYVWGTFDENTSELEKLIVYIHLSNDSFTANDAVKNLLGEGINARPDSVSNALMYLTRIGLLNLRNKHFRLANNILQKIIDSRFELPYLIDNAKQAAAKNQMAILK